MLPSERRVILVIDYYVEPVASEDYFHQFEVELNRCIQKKGPTSLTQRFKGIRYAVLMVSANTTQAECQQV